MTRDDGGFGSAGGTSDEVRVAQLLAGLADDPGAPPSTVTAMSVIAAAPQIPPHPQIPPQPQIPSQPKFPARPAVQQ